LAKSIIERSDAISIAAKIGADVNKSGAHQTATLRVNGILVLTFGIRHGAKSGHGHLCGSNGDLKLNEKRVAALARCTMSKDEYFEVLRDRGLLPKK
jgi:hypothetical protein